MTTMERAQVLETVREARAAGRRADLTGADLRGVNLTYSVLRGANLADADLARTNLTGANLTGADLAHANLYEANLYEADLTNANLTGALLEGAHFTPEQLLDTRGLQPEAQGLPRGIWDELLPTNPEQRQLVEHLLNDGWGGTLREAIATVEGLIER